MKCDCSSPARTSVLIISVICRSGETAEGRGRQKHSDDDDDDDDDEGAFGMYPGTGRRVGKPLHH